LRLVDDLCLWPDLGCGDVVIVDFLDDEVSSSVDVFVGCVVGAISLRSWERRFVRHSAEAENNGDFRLPGESWNNPWFWYGSSSIEIGYWLVINKREGLHTHSIREASALLILRQPFTVSLELLFADLASCV